MEHQIRTRMGTHGRIRTRTRTGTEGDVLPYNDEVVARWNYVAPSDIIVNQHNRIPVL